METSLTVFPLLCASFAILAASSYPIYGVRPAGVRPAARLFSMFSKHLSSFALIPLMHFSVKQGLRLSGFQWIRAGNNQLPASFPITLAETWHTIPAATGFTLPGIIDEPG
jgi:hypothetical protein